MPLNKVGSVEAERRRILLVRQMSPFVCEECIDGVESLGTGSAIKSHGDETCQLGNMFATVCLFGYSESKGARKVSGLGARGDR